MAYKIIPTQGRLSVYQRPQQVENCDDGKPPQKTDYIAVFDVLIGFESLAFSRSFILFGQNILRENSNNFQQFSLTVFIVSFDLFLCWLFVIFLIWKPSSRSNRRSAK
jgi:hypothetical protein